jgi:hypothetical protein
MLLISFMAVSAIKAADSAARLKVYTETKREHNGLCGDINNPVERLLYAVKLLACQGVLIL